MELTITKERALATLKNGFTKAEALLKDEQKINELLLRMEEKFKVIPGIGEKLSHIPAFISLVRSYIKKEYTKVPLGTLIAIISAIIYCVSPADLIPDTIPGFGIVDDAVSESESLVFTTSSSSLTSTMTYISSRSTPVPPVPYPSFRKQPATALRTSQPR